MVAIGYERANAQLEPTEFCPCKPDTLIDTIHEKLFDFNVNCPDGWSETVPGVWITIVYRRVTCNQFITNEIISSTLHTNYFQWIEVNGCQISLSDWVPIFPNLPPSINTTDRNHWSTFYNSLLNWAINNLLPPINPSTNPVSFASGCWANVNVIWPPGTKIYISRGDLGGFDSINLTHSIMSVPCEGTHVALCKSKMELLIQLFKGIVVMQYFHLHINQQSKQLTH